MAFVELLNIHKKYEMGQEEVSALHDFSLKVEQGEFVSIVGQSGSGKSTLMNLVGCLDKPSSGSYTLGGQSVESLCDRQLSRVRGRTIGFVFQGFNLIPSLTALENVELPLIYAGMGIEKRRKLAREALKQMGLAHRTNHRPGQMSGGQQQRVAIARAVVTSPSLILADEPTGNLDEQSSRDVMQTLTRLWQEGKTVLLITHDPTTARLAPRVVTLAGGRLVSDILA